MLQTRILPRLLTQSTFPIGYSIRSSNPRIRSFSMEPAPQRPPGQSQDFGLGKKKRPFQGGQGGIKKQKPRNQKAKATPVNQGGNDEVLLHDVRKLIAAQRLSDTPRSAILENTPAQGQTSTTVELESQAVANGENSVANVQSSLPAPFTEIEVKVMELSSTGDGLCIHPGSDQIYVVPFATPGDTLKVKVIRHHRVESYSNADFLSVVEAGPFRDDTRINCQYFSTCGGCSFQMMDYETQLAHKKTIVEKAYINFSLLPSELVPIIRDTIGSPLQYGYRTKLTPHFDAPPNTEGLSRRDRMAGKRNFFKEVPPIGFMYKGQKKTLDIEDCPIGTDAVRMGMKRERHRVVERLETYSKGVTILLRESTLRVPNDDVKASESIADTVKTVSPKYTEFKSCVTDNNAKSTEYIDDYVFTNTAGAFFQNNNSILPKFTQYIRGHILPPTPDSSEPTVKYLIDAYSGSGLFTITLSSLFTSSTGIDIAGPSIVSARENAALNALPPSRCTFIAADAPELFKSVTYPKDETVVMLDPPRKGCDESFLSQLLGFGPKRVVYVSCNVHTQARDVGVLVRGAADGRVRYKIESLVGFDFFPQTSHVEGVAVLSRIDEAKGVDSMVEGAQAEQALL